MKYDTVVHCKDGYFVRWQPPVGGPTLRKFHRYSPLDWTRWAFGRIATPIHFWRVRRYVRTLPNA